MGVDRSSWLVGAGGVVCCVGVFRGVLCESVEGADDCQGEVDFSEWNGDGAVDRGAAQSAVDRDGKAGEGD